MAITARTFAIALGAVILLVGVIALLWPVGIDSSNQDQHISCGNAISSDLTEAQQADTQNPIGTTLSELGLTERPDNVAQCNDALSTRRAWAWPVTAAGAVVLAAGLLVRGQWTGRWKAARR
ncbi:MAG: aminopeptidase [Rhodococcus sp. (in: high G+C Gram-positive bacteria)]|uniref:aminopeptidase n=1 Tax=Rhodococcus sp. TaxID=1831 RepID=UPI003BB21A89